MESVPTKESPNYNLPTADGDYRVKVICLGDSAVGKSKLVDRFLVDGFKPYQLSTYALTMYQHKMVIGSDSVLVDIWDTAGQEQFQSMHPSYYHQAHACILVFDITRKTTYKNLVNWYRELKECRPDIPCLCAANKIDVDIQMTRKNFQLPKKFGIPLYFVSASDGTNVVKLFKDAVTRGLNYKKNPTDFMDQVLQELETFQIDDDDFGNE